jgi:hypothetical protein
MSDPGSAVTARVDQGSFRDRDGRVYLFGDRVLRGLSQTALDHFRELTKTGFYQKFSASGELVATRELDDSAIPELPQWPGYLEHDRVSFISYPYEWTYSMLRDAALLQLRLLEAALKEGWTMKDATPYNVQFVDGKAVFIDIPSFEPWPEGSPWNGYRQFCEMNLFPLMLQSYKGLGFHPFLRARIGGIDVQAAAKIFSARDRFRRGVFSHVWLQALMDRKYGNSKRDLRSELGDAGFGRELVLANVRKLKKLLSGMAWTDEESEWAEYEEFHNYSKDDQQAKIDFVDQAAKVSGAQLAWDIGCNTGRFSQIIARHCQQVLAMDADHLAVERLYNNASCMESGRILPLVQNIADPSPSWGWNHLERTRLEQRGRPGLVMCLALIHHIVIGANIPLDSFISWLATLGGDLIIEYVSRGDDKVEQLLRNRVDQFQDYSKECFEENIEKHFNISNRMDLNTGLRTLYLCKLKKPEN